MSAVKQICTKKYENKSYNVNNDSPIKQMVHIGPDVICEKINTVQTKNSYACCKCNKKVQYLTIKQAQKLKSYE